MKTKYDPKTFPVKAGELAKKGYSNKQIAESLGIGEDTFYSYVKKHTKFAKSLTDNRIKVTIEVQKAYLSRCVGFDYEQQTSKITKDFETKKTQTVEISKTNKKVLPHVGACKNWLKVHMPEVWGEDQKKELEGFESFADLVTAIAEEDENGK